MQGARRYSFFEVYHALAKEPFNLPRAEIMELCPVVVRHCYFRKDEDAGGMKEEKGGPGSERSLFSAFHGKLGASKEQIEAGWQRSLKARGRPAQQHPASSPQHQKQE